MAACRVPLELDLRSLPARAAEVEVEIDLAQLAAHTGGGDPPAVDHLAAELPDGRRVPVQHSPRSGTPGLLLALPADVAARDGAALTLLLSDAAPPRTPPRVVFSQGTESVALMVEGEPFAVYRYNTAAPELPRPYFHPILGPGGQPITQDGEFPGTSRGHVWHTGLVLAHQNFTGGNNWQTGSPRFSRMRHLAFDVMESGAVAGRFVERLEWPDTQGERVVFRETRVVTVPARPAGRRCIDVESTITCGDQAAVWNATPYHLLAIRVPDAMLVDRGGVITNSEGGVNPADGTPGRWLDYSGPAGQGGVALLDHPENPRHPPPWLNFKHQTVGAAPTHREPYAWQPGEALRFRYRVYVHSGDVRGGAVAEEYAAFAAAVPARAGVPSRGAAGC